MALTVTKISTLLVAALLPALADAQTLADPTRPPAAFQAPVAGDEVGAGPQLQSVRIPRSGKPGALISGHYVELGGRYGDAVLVAVREDAVVLRSPAGRETLKLTPDAAKTPALPVTKKPAPGARSRPDGAAIESSGGTA